MAKKEKIDIVRSKDFSSVDDELAAALAQLDEANVRVTEVLDSEKLDALLNGAAESDSASVAEEATAEKEGESEKNEEVKGDSVQQQEETQAQSDEA